MTIRFDEQVVIVTGAGAGLGRCHALEFARRGAKVVINDLGPNPDGSAGPSEAAQSVVKEIEDFGGIAMAHGASVTHEGGVADMVKAVMDRFGRIDVLVNNAGILGDKSFHKMTLEGFKTVLGVHLMGFENSKTLLEQRLDFSIVDIGDHSIFHKIVDRLMIRQFVRCIGLVEFWTTQFHETIDNFFCICV